MKKTAFIGIVFGLFLTASSVLAAPPSFKPMELATPGTSGTLVLPAPADNAPVLDVLPLGSALDPGSGKVVEGYAFIHYDQKTAKPGDKPGKGGGGSACYAYLANGAKWKSAESWLMNAANTRGLNGTNLFNTQDGALAKWEDASDGTVGSGPGYDIFGSGSATSSALVADTSSPDNQNEVYFANISNSGVIAVTIVWGIFAGPPQGRELVEWDQVYDDVDYNWSLTGESGKMDFDNIATHEDGHSAGMDHPDDSCINETMYRFADFGETKKRTLNTGDIAGVNALY